MTEAAELYLIWHDAAESELALGEPHHAFRPNLILARSERSRSRLYHAVKRQLPDDTALLVAPLADAPKFKGMSPGSLKWLGDRL